MTLASANRFIRLHNCGKCECGTEEGPSYWDTFLGAWHPGETRDVICDRCREAKDTLDFANAPTFDFDLLLKDYDPFK